MSSSTTNRRTATNASKKSSVLEATSSGKNVKKRVATSEVYGETTFRGRVTSQGPKSFTVCVVFCLGTCLLAAGIVLIILYGNRSDSTEDLLIVGGCLVAIGILFLGVALVFASRAVLRSRKVRALANEQSQRTSNLEDKNYLEGRDIVVNMADVDKKERPRAGELYGGQTQLVSSVKEEAASLCPLPLVAYPLGGHVPGSHSTFKAPMVVDKKEDNTEELNKDS